MIRNGYVCGETIFFAAMIGKSTGWAFGIKVARLNNPYVHVRVYLGPRHLCFEFGGEK